MARRFLWVFVFCSACGGSTIEPPPDGGISDSGVEPDSGVVSCPAPSAGPTMHMRSPSSDETWTAAGSPHIVASEISIPIGTTLTIEPCAEVRVAPGLSIHARGALRAVGTASQPIKITARDASPWAQLSTSGGQLFLEHVTVENGGDPLNRVAELAGMIWVQGADPSVATATHIHTRHVSVLNSASNGIVVFDGAGFSDESANLTISGSAIYPVSIWSRAAGTLPSGTYTGNIRDFILLPGIALNEGVAESTTYHDRGVPYHVGLETSSGELRVSNSNGQPTLTLSPGVVLRFKRGGSLLVEPSSGVNPARGALIAAGTPDNPIVLTSAEPSPAAGDWLGVWYGQVPDPSNRLEYVVVEYAGRESGSGSDTCQPTMPGARNAGAIRIRSGEPVSQFITNTTIRESAGHGIDRGWRGNVIDFLPTNTFENIAGCTQSYPKDRNGACPMNPPCPME